MLCRCQLEKHYVFFLMLYFIFCAYLTTLTKEPNWLNDVNIYFTGIKINSHLLIQSGSPVFLFCNVYCLTQMNLRTKLITATFVVVTLAVKISLTAGLMLSYETSSMPMWEIFMNMVNIYLTTHVFFTCYTHQCWDQL